ncbi:MAG: glycosyltransferase family 9 protein [Candidatus Aenigmatarchaeota archaeon]
MKYKKILILKLGAIGDLVMLTPAISLLRKAYPNAEISLLVAKEYKDVIEDNPYIDKFIIAENFKKGQRNYIKIMNLLKKIRKENFDLIINCHTSFKMNLFAFLTGIKERIGFDLNGGYLNTKVLHYSEIKNKHDSEKYIELMRLVGVKLKPRVIRYELFFPKELENIINVKLREKNIRSGDKIVGFVVGGGSDSRFHLNRRWPIANWIKLANEIYQKEPKTKILLIGDKNDWEISEGVRKMTKNTINVCGKFTIKETMALMKQLDYLVTTDTGPMHIGAAFTKVIALFGPTDPKQFGPQPIKKHLVIQNKMKCSPCYKNEKYKKCYNNICMKHITPYEIFYLLFK